MKTLLICLAQPLDPKERRLIHETSLGQPALAGNRNSEWPYFRVYYDHSRIVHSDHTSRQKQYQSRSPGDEAGRLCSMAIEVVCGSKAIRAEVKSRVVSVQASKTETHKKTSDAISRNMQEAKSMFRDMILERGQVRLAQNSTLHQQHGEEIALGIALGPVSDKHWSVSEKVERPLSQMRPGSAAEERENFRQTKRKLTRQLSASSERASLVNSTDKRLANQLREGSQSVFLDSQTLRVRRMSLDNRCNNYACCIMWMYALLY
ncbi:uncharacterized protein LOC135347883 isoform X2 [Halichondria panicea]|uniref:uncharacterized protein LOC135347883 isoform X2 n=1 Tax=Halichondria panicea TaxID=6063 RepID=UPI00312B7BC1